MSVLKIAATMALGLTVGGLAMAQEQGRVLSSTPIIEQTAVPRQVCSTGQATVTSEKSGAGAVMGALAGGGLGNAMGQGAGKAALTALGLVGGALLGNSIEGSATQTQAVQTCSIQTSYENRIAAYSVTYEFNGKQYSVQMRNPPGPFIPLQVTPVGLSNEAPGSPPANPAPLAYVEPGPVSAYAPLATSINLQYGRWTGHR